MKKLYAKLIIKIFDYIEKKQKRAHKSRMEKLNKKILSGNICNEKFYSSSGATLNIKNKNKQDYKEKIEKIVTLYLQEPKKLFDYIKGASTPIYVRKNASKILSKINEDEGFILPKKGLQALYLNLVLNKKISFKTKEMFLISSYDVNIYAFIYQFYNWYCYKLKLNGYEDKAQNMFKFVFDICESPLIDKLSFEEVLGLKSAIRRDIEAIEFVQRIVRKNKTLKDNLQKIKQGKSIRV